MDLPTGSHSIPMKNGIDRMMGKSITQMLLQEHQMTTGDLHLSSLILGRLSVISANFFFFFSYACHEP